MAFSGITKLISQLTATTSISDTDNLIVGNTDAKKITWAQIIALIKTKLNIGNEDISGIGDGTITGALAGLNGKLKTQSFTAPVILPGKGDGSVNMGSLNIPTGYTYIGVISKDSDYGDQFLCSFQRYGDHIHAVVKNVYVNQLSGDVSCTALFLKN